MDIKEKVEANENVEKVKSPPENNIQEEKQKPKVKKRFTIWDYIHYLLSAGESKVSTIIFELLASFILLIYLLFTKANIQSWLGNTIRYSIGGIVSMAGLGTGLNYLYNSYNNNLPQNKKPEKVSYDLNGNSRINFWEYSASLLAAKEEKFSTIALVNLLSFGIAIYMQLTGQIVPQIITDTIQTSILGLSAMNVLGTGFGMPGYNGYSSYGYGSMGYGGYDNYGYTQGYGYQTQTINTQATNEANNDGQDPV
jgi:hypothetical protein